MKNLLFVFALLSVLKVQGQSFITIPTNPEDLPTQEYIKAMAGVEFSRIDLGITYCNFNRTSQERKDAIYQAFKKAYGECFSSDFSFEDFLKLKNEESKRTILKTCIEEKMYKVAFFVLNLYEIRAAVENAKKD